MRSPIRWIVVLVIAAGAVYLVGNARVGLWDRDEPRYAQCARQMLQSGDWVVPRLYDNLRANKPPLIYWCQASAMWVLGDNASAARVPSVIAMLGTLIVVAIGVRRGCGDEQAFWTAFVVATSALAIMAAKICLTDSVLVLFTTIAQLCLFAIWRGNRSWTVALKLAVMIGLGGMTKGPFIIGTLATTLAALAVFHGIDRWSQRRGTRRAAGFEALPKANDAMGPVATTPPPPTDPVPASTPTAPPVHWGRSIAQLLVGIAIVAAVVLPWIVLVHHRAGDFLQRSMAEARAHLESGKEGHSFPPGFHLATVWATFMPWSLLLPMTIGLAWRNRAVPEVRFALAAVLGPWLMVEFMGTKLPHYFLSAFPPLAFLTADAIRRNLRGDAHDMRSRPFLIGAAIWSIVIALIGALPWLAARWFRPIPWGAMSLLTLLTLTYAVGVFAMLRAGRLAPAVLTMGIGMLVFIAALCGVYLPQAAFLRISPHVADVLRREGATYKGDVVMVDYKEPSLGFYQGGTIREMKKDELLAKPIGQWTPWLVITRQVWQKMNPAQRDALRIVDTYRGWAYADQGRIIEVMVVKKQ